MTNDAPFDAHQLDRYLAGDLTGDERAHVDAWLQSHRVTAAMLRDLPRAALGAAERVDTDSAWNALAARIGAENGDELGARRVARAAVSAPATRGNRAWIRGAAEIAAAFVLVFGGISVWRGMQRSGGSLTAPRGREMTAVLPDGTRLTLAAGSTASWSATFGRPTRDVTLQGQGLFDVVHDGAHPFRVHTRDAIAEDIGTRFVVRAWPELSGVEVAVVEGVVALADSLHAGTDRGVTIHAGQRGRLTPDGQVLVTADAGASLAWAHGELAFDNRPLSEVLPEISRRFDVEIGADSALADRRLSARFAAQSLDDVLNALAASLDVRVLTSGRVITLVPASR